MSDLLRVSGRCFMVERVERCGELRKALRVVGKAVAELILTSPLRFAPVYVHIVYYEPRTTAMVYGHMTLSARRGD